LAEAKIKVSAFELSAKFTNQQNSTGSVAPVAF
jgi:hypothetical protein